MIDFGHAAPPRSNGELVFTAPWQQRVFGLTMAMSEAGRIELEAFRQRLIVRIAEDGDRPYWESWTAAFEDLVVASELVTEASVDERQHGLIHEHH